MHTQFLNSEVSLFENAFSFFLSLMTVVVDQTPRQNPRWLTSVWKRRVLELYKTFHKRSSFSRKTYLQCSNFICSTFIFLLLAWFSKLMSSQVVFFKNRGWFRTYQANRFTFQWYKETFTFKKALWQLYAHHMSFLRKPKDIYKKKKKTYNLICLPVFYRSLSQSRTSGFCCGTESGEC